MTSAPLLFAERRACVCCGAEATPKRRVHGEPNILSVGFNIYRRGNGKRDTKAAVGVRICEGCFIRALASPRLFEGREARKFLAAIRQSLSGRYSVMLSEDCQ